MRIVLIECLEIFTRVSSSVAMGLKATRVSLFTGCVAFCDIVFNCCPALTAFETLIGSCASLLDRFSLIHSLFATDIVEVFIKFSVACTEFRYSTKEKK